MLYTSGFLDGVMFFYNGPYGGVTLQQQSRGNGVSGLASLLRGIGCVLC